MRRPTKSRSNGEDETNVCKFSMHDWQKFRKKSKFNEILPKKGVIRWEIVQNLLWLIKKRGSLGERKSKRGSMGDSELKKGVNVSMLPHQQFLGSVPHPPISPTPPQLTAICLSLLLLNSIHPLWTIYHKNPTEEFWFLEISKSIWKSHTLCVTQRVKLLQRV